MSGYVQVYPQKLPFVGDLGRHLIRGCVGPSESTTQTALGQFRCFEGLAIVSKRNEHKQTYGTRDIADDKPHSRALHAMQPISLITIARGTVVERRSLAGELSLSCA